MGKLNPWFAEKLCERGLEGATDPPLRVIIEVEPKEFENVQAALRRLGVRITGSSFGTFIYAVVPSEMLDTVSKIPGVKMIHYDRPVTISSFLPFRLKMNDPLLGEVYISGVEVPEFKLPGPLFVPPTFAALLPRIKRRDVEIIPTYDYIGKVVDIQTTLRGEGVIVAGIDTGLTTMHPQFAMKGAKAETAKGLPEPPQDYMAHGMWISGMIAGRWVPTRFGHVGGVAPNAHMIHVKALSTLGFGQTSWILDAMERAWKQGAQVISMSLGGEPEGSVETDPFCKAAEIISKSGTIIVVAAGNSGPSSWTVASPGFCPQVLTVGSVSLMDDEAPAWFSSRGPSGKWYREHKDEWARDHAKYGALIEKPDVVCFGGGRASSSTKPDEVLYQGVTGWFDGFYDLAADGFEGMHGTCLVGDTMVKTIDGWVEIKNVEVGTKVVAADVKESSASVVYSKVDGKFTRPKSDIYVLKLPGRELWATGDHPILVLRKLDYGYRFEWLTIEQLMNMSESERTHLRVVSMHKAPTPRTDKTVGTETAWFLGYFLGDGWVTPMKRTYMISIADSYNKDGNSKPDSIRAVELARKLFGLNMRLYRHKRGARYWRAFSKRVGELLIKLGIAGKKAGEKTIPDWIFTLPYEERLAFLEGLIAADGSTDSFGRWRLETASKELARKVWLLSMDLGGNVSNIMVRERRVRVPSTGKYITSKTYYLQIELLSLRKYRNMVIGTSTYSAPSIGNWLDEYLDIRRIVSIEYAGREVTYDIAIANYHSFVANGIIVHNSQATPCVSGLMTLVKQAMPEVDVYRVKRALSGLGEKTIDKGWGRVSLSLLARLLRGG